MNLTFGHFGILFYREMEYRLNILLAEILLQVPIVAYDIDDGDVVNIPNSYVSSMRMVRFHAGEQVASFAQLRHGQQRAERSHAVVNAAVLLLRIDLNGHVLSCQELTLGSVVAVVGLALLVAKWPAAVGAQVGPIDSTVARQANRVRRLFRTDDQRFFEDDDLSLLNVPVGHQVPSFHSKINQSNLL